jgi:hypothetical protein
MGSNQLDVNLVFVHFDVCKYILMNFLKTMFSKNI